MSIHKPRVGSHIDQGQATSSFSYRSSWSQIPGIDFSEMIFALSHLMDEVSEEYSERQEKNQNHRTLVRPRIQWQEGKPCCRDLSLVPLPSLSSSTLIPKSQDYSLFPTNMLNGAPFYVFISECAPPSGEGICSSIRFSEECI